MSPERQRIAIAEACGWTYDPTEEDWKWFDKEGEGYRHCPDYTSDLNAMHEAEKVLTDKQFMEYNGHLGCSSEYGDWWNKNLSHATAAQRAEAFLKTIGKWEDA